eukprot:CAMPEP_0119060326 /NCGR_PEP_ID=MMETSP1178-20130426/4315_1 /TAXON_ID=33656 /ORGANISM="unid sp, Strain CCMP2000" /LENGTH=149 /DNA_ID=CAMNT_0007041423 /DNA_START=148 /DNA_END=595 /DNA_ORIENTATION=-
MKRVRIDTRDMQWPTARDALPQPPRLLEHIAWGDACPVEGGELEQPTEHERVLYNVWHRREEDQYRRDQHGAVGAGGAVVPALTYLVDVSNSSNVIPGRSSTNRCQASTSPRRLLEPASKLGSTSESGACARGAAFKLKVDFEPALRGD